MKELYTENPIENLAHSKKLSHHLITIYDNILLNYNESNIDSLKLIVKNLKFIFGEDQYFYNKIKFISENENTPEVFIIPLQKSIIFLNKLFEANITDLELIAMVTPVNVFIDNITIMIFIVM
jgi:hypothetical protein